MIPLVLSKSAQQHGVLKRNLTHAELQGFISVVVKNIDNEKIQKVSDQQFSALFHFLNARGTFACLPTGHEKTLIYQVAVLVAQTQEIKYLSSRPFVFVVSPLSTLISDQIQSCKTRGLKAMKLKKELFDKPDRMKELEEAEVV